MTPDEQKLVISLLTDGYLSDKKPYFTWLGLGDRYTKWRYTKGAENDTDEARRHLANLLLEFIDHKPPADWQKISQFEALVEAFKYLELPLSLDIPEDYVDLYVRENIETDPDHADYLKDFDNLLFVLKSISAESKGELIDRAMQKCGLWQPFDGHYRHNDGFVAGIKVLAEINHLDPLIQNIRDRNNWSDIAEVLIDTDVENLDIEIQALVAIGASDWTWLEKIGIPAESIVIEALHAGVTWQIEALFRFLGKCGSSKTKSQAFDYLCVHVSSYSLFDSLANLVGYTAKDFNNWSVIESVAERLTVVDDPLDDLEDCYWGWLDDLVGVDDARIDRLYRPSFPSSKAWTYLVTAAVLSRIDDSVSFDYPRFLMDIVEMTSGTVATDHFSYSYDSEAPKDHFLDPYNTPINQLGIDGTEIIWCRDVAGAHYRSSSFGPDEPTYSGFEEDLAEWAIYSMKNRTEAHFGDILEWVANIEDPTFEIRDSMLEVSYQSRRDLAKAAVAYRQHSLVFKLKQFIRRFH